MGHPKPADPGVRRFIRRIEAAGRDPEGAMGRRATGCRGEGGIGGAPSDCNPQQRHARCEDGFAEQILPYTFAAREERSDGSLTIHVRCGSLNQKFMFTEI